MTLGSGSIWTSWGTTRPSTRFCTWVRAILNINTDSRWTHLEPCEGGLEHGGWQNGHDPTRCTHSPESKLGPDTSKWVRPACRGRWLSTSPLLWWHPTWVLCPAQVPGEGPGEDHKDGQNGGTPLQWRKAERVGVVQLKEEKVPGRPQSSLTVPKGGVQERQWQIFLARPEVTRSNGFKSV